MGMAVRTSTRATCESEGQRLAPSPGADAESPGIVLPVPVGGAGMAPPGVGDGVVLGGVA